MDKFLDLLSVTTRSDTKSFTSLNVAKELEKLILLNASNPSVLHLICDKNYQYLRKDERFRYQLAKLLPHLQNVDFDAQIGVSRDTPLHVAVSSGYEHIVKFLIDHGSNKKLSNAQGLMPFHVAIIEQSSLSMIKIVFDKDINYGSTGVSYMNEPLFICAVRNYESSLDEPNKQKEQLDKLKIIKFLLENDKTCVNCQTQPHRNTALHYLCRNKLVSIDVLALFLKLGSDPNRKNSEGCTAFHIAAEKQNIEVIDLFSNNGADINILSDDGKNILHFAAKNNNVFVIKYFLQKGVDVNQLSHGCNFTPLFEAVWEDLTFIVKELLNANAHVNQRIINKQTVLHVAVEINSPRIVEVLLEHGSDINAVDAYGNTPLSIFCTKNCHAPLIQSSIYSQIMYILVKHISVQIEAKYFVNDQNMQLITIEPIQSFFKKCMEEITVMKNTEVVDGISFFQIVIRPPCRLVSLMQQKDLYNAFINSNYIAKFPIYKDNLSSKMFETKKRTKCTDSARASLHQIIQESWNNVNYPDLIIRKVLDHLNVYELENLSNVYTNLYTTTD